LPPFAPLVCSLRHLRVRKMVLVQAGGRKALIDIVCVTVEPRQSDRAYRGDVKRY
jgi:hypothetical protein